MTRFTTGNKWIYVDLLLMAAIFGFLLCYFEPRLLLLKTTTTGGDTASHYYIAHYLTEHLLPQGKISGWCQGRLAGYPMLQYYFPLPFVLIGLLSHIIPFQIAFKLITVLGTFLLPPFTYLFFRLLRQPFPVPIIGAAFSLGFLFSEGFTMWGGNIPSTLAGQFSHSLGMALTVLWLGLLHRNLSENKDVSGCTLILAMIGLCHGYTLLFCGFASLFFLFVPGKFAKNLKKLLLIHIGAFCLMAFWLLPLLIYLPYTTKISMFWAFYTWKEAVEQILPTILWPFVGLALAGTVSAFAVKGRRPGAMPALGVWAYIWYLVVCGAALYSIGYRLKVVDVRFLPFSIFFLTASGALLFSAVSAHRGKGALLSAILVLAAMLWVDHRVTNIHSWIRLNYSGFENQPLWPHFSAVNEHLKGSVRDPRVAYEYSPVNDRAGTLRAFESLPLFSGRSTLEGVQIQTSLCVPFIFYIQSEISQLSPTPVNEYVYPRFDLRRALDHLALFNVKQFIAVDERTKKAADRMPALEKTFESGPYSVYELKDCSGRYVEPLAFKPVVRGTGNWRQLAYRWFRLSHLAVPVVFKDNIEPHERERFVALEKIDVKRLPGEAIDTPGLPSETVSEDEVLIEGATVGKPLMIKIAYHPGWRVEGADRIYLVSPAFMLVYPTSPRVRLYYARTWPDRVGLVLTLLGLLGVGVLRFGRFAKTRSVVSSMFDRFGKPVFWSLTGVIGAAFAYYLIYSAPEYPSARYTEGLKHFARGDYAAAGIDFKYVIDTHPFSIVGDYSIFLYGACF
ncbi:MAG: hypothetical protein JRJ60_20430, partial [Deltaproteobacteria bacterium]|nr:hypothetical protein [Deltaproteobacteria bacterium]